MLVCIVVNCPVDNIKLSVVVSNLAVAEQIRELLVHCRYGVEPTLTACDDGAHQYQVNPNGCPVTVRASAKRSVNERACRILCFLLLLSRDFELGNVCVWSCSQ